MINLTKIPVAGRLSERASQSPPPCDFVVVALTDRLIDRRNSSTGNPLIAILSLCHQYSDS